MVTNVQTHLTNAGLKALGVRFDASPAWKFFVEVQSVIVAEFQECSGLSMEREVMEVKEGGTNDFEWLLPGRIKYGPITLKKGITYNRELWRWFCWGMLDGQVWGVDNAPDTFLAVKMMRTMGVKIPQGISI